MWKTWNRKHFFSAFPGNQTMEYNFILLHNDNRGYCMLPPNIRCLYASVFKVCLLSLKPWALKCSIKFPVKFHCSAMGMGDILLFGWLQRGREKGERAFKCLGSSDKKNFGCFSKIASPLRFSFDYYY